jgi:hypothetical protein
MKPELGGFSLEGNNGFVDVHVHPPTEEFVVDAGGPYVEAAAKKFGHSIELKTFDQMLEEFSASGVERSVLFAWDAESTNHRPRVSNEFISGIVERYPDQIIGFASVDPHKKSALRDLEFAIHELKLSGLKLHPQVQAFEPPQSRLLSSLFQMCRVWCSSHLSHRLYLLGGWTSGRWGSEASLFQPDVIG